MPENNEGLTIQERAGALFGYLKELSTLKLNPKVSVDDYTWIMYVHELLEDKENVEVIYRDRTETEEPEAEPDPAILRIHKPEFTFFPAPAASFSDWIEPGWNDFHNEVAVIQQKGADDSDAELFDSDEDRVNDFNTWNAMRSLWKKKQEIIENTRNRFMSLYQTYIDVNRESESMEVVVADGIFVDSENGAIKHPLITRRVAITFDSAANTLQIEDLDVNSELYSLVLREVNGINANAVSSINDELHDNDFHPLDRNDTPEFLKSAIHRLSSESYFSKDGMPEDWKSRGRFLVYSDPVFIYRKRVDGTPGFIQNILERIETSGEVPAPIAETVRGGKIDIAGRDHDMTIEEQLAAVGGEDPDILLSKEANKEQLEIAQRIELYNGVLVQGPPGTGKTHTIANLMGHFLAQGKSVLVTSQTPKALQVLKDKLPLNIQPLCVSVLNDKNIDMVRSVDGISSFMAHNTSSALKRDSELLGQERREIIKALGEVRKNIYSVIRAESTDLEINGEKVSPSKAADFVFENQDTLSYIPGKVAIGEKLPLSYSELIDLYHSNAVIDGGAEQELECELPAPDNIPSPAVFADQVSDFEQCTEKKSSILNGRGWSCGRINSGRFTLDIGHKELELVIPEKDRIEELAKYIRSFEEMEDWMKYAAIDGERGGAYLARWNKLIEKIDEACSEREKLVEATFGREVEYESIDSLLENEEAFAKLHDLYEKKGKISKLDFLTNKNLAPALSLAMVNGKKPESREDCGAVLHTIYMEKILRDCGKFWNELIGKRGSRLFTELDEFEPEQVAKRWIPSIKYNLTWYGSALDDVDSHLSSIGIQTRDVLRITKEDSALQITEKIIAAITTVIPGIVNLCHAMECTNRIQGEWNDAAALLNEGKRVHSEVCRILISAIENRDIETYKAAYATLEEVYEKYHLQSVRRDTLERLALVAPDWAEAIRSRNGIHGESSVPQTVEDAWKWKQYSGKLAEILSSSYDELQKESTSLSKKYRELTGQYAEKLAWYHLLSRTETDIDMRQALNGWKLTVRKIGKGTGKNVPKLKAEARKLMASCQNAVPAWIMPMSRVIETLDPRTNQFDVVIVDEASQSDVTALGVMFLGKKIVVVGDDQQVSPMGIGTDQRRMDALEDMYIRGKIPNSHLYGSTTSLYDIAATTYQPLMLREHFRCVPDIIGFSNGLSYDYRIKPLRDAGSSSLTPAVVNYRVEGERQGRVKKNQVEAKTVVSLIQACLQQEEYADKSFGVISLLGDDQAKLISSLIFKYIKPQDIEKHQILCGNPSHFQGDERDVIILSMVDSPNENGPLSLQEFGAGESNRKRYNVAASRAKDQLWVVNSLDPAYDLKPGDLRKRLIEYATAPSAFEQMHKEIEQNAESPFEAAVADALVLRGYKLKQELWVGAYRLDIVATDGKKQVAIECDGERYHSGEAKIREDMERQTILERSGWRFIRIRGSEYFRNPNASIERVVSELHKYGIEPSLSMDPVAKPENELLKRIKDSAKEFYDKMDESGPNSFKAIGDALTATATPDEYQENIFDYSDDTGNEPDLCASCYCFNNPCAGEPGIGNCTLYKEKE